MSNNPVFPFYIASIVLLLAFQLLALRLLLRRHGGGGRVIRAVGRASGFAIIALLDFPLIHVFVLYKFYNPLVLDQLMNQLAAPWVALHLTTFVWGAIILIDHYIVEPRRRRKSEAKAIEQSALASLSPRETIDPSDTLIQRVDLLPTRRRFIRTATLAAGGFIAGSATLSAMRSSDDYRLERVVVRIPELPEELKGTTIAMVSDIHSSVFMNREEMEMYKNAVNALKADMIFVPGDFVNSKLREVYPFCEAFTGLSAPHGVYGVLGNHDYYTGAVETVATEVSNCGIRLLRNENVSIEKGGKKLWLMGVDDGSVYDVRQYIEDGKSARGTIENMVRGIPDGDKRILLCHKPYPFEEYTQLGMDLMVSGHTHGGQVVIAQLDNVNLSFAAIASKYIAGLYKAQSNPKTQMYITRGVGTVGIPLRVNCPPEITHITLV